MADRLSHPGPAPRQPAPAATPRPKRSALERGISALPDAVTACTFAWLWVSPASFGKGALGTATLVMLVEFLMVHATGFLAGFAFSNTGTRLRRALAILGMTLFYLLFLLAFCFIFKAWWPLAVFGWLVLSKLVATLGPAPNDAKRNRVMTGWGISVLFYILGVFLTVMAPIPALGITPAVIAAAELTGSGVWVEQPYRVVAFGALYFAALAVGKWRGWDDGAR